MMVIDKVPEEDIPSISELAKYIIYSPLNHGWNQFIVDQNLPIVPKIIALIDKAAGYKTELYGSIVDVRYNVVTGESGQVTPHPEGTREDDLTANLFLTGHGGFNVEGEGHVDAERGRLVIFSSLKLHWSDPLTQGQPDRHTFIVQVKRS
jgi:hypothetical protein